MKQKIVLALMALAVSGTANATNTPLTTEQITGLVSGLDMDISTPVILAIAAAIIAFVMFKGSIMSGIAMIQNAARR